MFPGDSGVFECYVSNKEGEIILRSEQSFIPVVPVLGKSKPIFIWSCDVKYSGNFIWIECLFFIIWWWLKKRSI